MSRLLVFTENYRVSGGGASYLVDLVNAVSSTFDDAVLASNPDGLAPDTSSRLQLTHSVHRVQVWTSDRLWIAVTNAGWLPWRERIASELCRIASLADPLLFAYNVAVCRREIRHARPSAVLSFNGGYPAGRSVLSMVVAASQERVPVILAIASMPTERARRLRRPWDERMDVRVADAVDLVVLNARSIGAALSTMRGIPARKIRVVHNALPDVASCVDMRHSGRLRVGCVSRMDAMKGTRYLVQAFATIAEGFPNAELVLVGDGPERSNVERLVASLGLGDRVTVTGQYEGDIACLVSGLDVYAFPSLWEGLPYSLLEAMRAGTAIVATDVGGVSEAVVDGRTGLLVPPASAGALAEALAVLLSDDALRARLGASARAAFVESFSLNAMQRRAEEVFAELGALSAAEVERSHGL